MSVAAVDPPFPPPAKRWSLRGDLPWRMLHAGVLGAPWFLEGLYGAFWSGVIGLCAHQPRRGLAANLAALGISHPQFRAWLAFRRFGEVAVDGIRSLNDEILEWEVEGREHLQSAMDSGLPVVLWTAHMGSYDVAASFFAHRLGTRMHAVRRPEMNPHLQAIREKSLRRMESDNLVTLYNDGREQTLALELMRVLRDGQWVALQADRALPGLSTFDVEADGIVWTLPKGPFVLPIVARAACLPVFIHRTGPRRYHVCFHPMVTPPRQRDHKDASEKLARAWLELLVPTVRQAPDQWFVFEQVARRATPESA